MAEILSSSLEKKADVFRIRAADFETITAFSLSTIQPDRPEVGIGVMLVQLGLWQKSVCRRKNKWAKWDSGWQNNVKLETDPRCCGGNKSLSTRQTFARPRRCGLTSMFSAHTAKVNRHCQPAVKHLIRRCRPYIITISVLLLINYYMFMRICILITVYIYIGVRICLNKHHIWVTPTNQS